MISSLFSTNETDKNQNKLVSRPTGVAGQSQRTFIVMVKDKNNNNNKVVVILYCCYCNKIFIVMSTKVKDNKQSSYQNLNGNETVA